MHYIVGTKITLTSQGSKKITTGMTSQQIRQRSGGMSAFAEQRKLLQPGEQYSLIRICKKEDKICYIFTSQTSERCELMFDSVTQAESFISELRGESIPDYSEVYNNQTD